MNRRDHFVYAAYDADGICLYVGCTGQPEARYRSHMRGNGDARGWFDPYVTRWRVSGPYGKRTARRIEKQRIAELAPIFNGQTPGNEKGRRAVVKTYMSLHGHPMHEEPALDPSVIERALRRRAVA